MSDWRAIKWASIFGMVMVSAICAAMAVESLSQHQGPFFIINQTTR